MALRDVLHQSTMYTIEGGALALAIYAVWPTWAGRSARASFAAMLDAQGAYVDALLSPFVDPATLQPSRTIRRLASKPT